MVTDYNHFFFCFILSFFCFILQPLPWLQKKVRSDYAQFYVQVCGLRSGGLSLIFAVNNQSEVNCSLKACKERRISNINHPIFLLTLHEQNLYSPSFSEKVHYCAFCSLLSSI